MMLIANLSLPPTDRSDTSEGGGGASQSQNVAADWIVMPFSRSSSMESIFAPTASRPRTSWISLMRPV